MTLVNSFVIIVTCSILLIYFVNAYLINKNYLAVFNFIILSESVTLTFFFGKFPFIYSFPLILVSFIYFNKSINNSQNLNHKLYKSSLVASRFYPFLKLFGYFLIIFIINYEYFSDKTFSSNDLLIFLLALLSIFYSRLSLQYSKETDFALIFTLMLVCFFLVPRFFLKIIEGEVGEESEKIYDPTKLVYLFLGLPMEIILSKLGFLVSADGLDFTFYRIDSKVPDKVIIGESCSGIVSVKIFISALTSYLLVHFRRFNSIFVSLLIIGLILSYISNLLRMMIIILIGIYYGMDSLLLAHEYFGWILFTIWMLIFWPLVDNLIKVGE